ncbi:hypothetical protein GCM10022291_30710 [Postechiella marina]|uniref:histidine kinase n=1 Tax=Postechiella marina TaxID=943941 RepID=A0ABP8CG72_9FLAO
MAFFVLIKSHILTQGEDAFLISKSGKQSMLSQRIVKAIFALDSDTRLVPAATIKDSLKVFTKELEQTHEFLLKKNKETKRASKLNSLFRDVDVNLKTLVKTSDSISSLPDFKLNKKTQRLIKETELSFLFGMDAIVNEYLKIAQANFISTKNSYYTIFGLSVLILTVGFFFLWFPNIQQLIRKNELLIRSNEKLAHSKLQIKQSLNELKELKIDLEHKERFNKIFINQAPPSIAMLDKDMKYMAVSEKWKQDYNMEGQVVIGRSHYEVFPEIKQEWKEQHKKCLAGYIDKCEEAPFVRADGSVQWIFWDVRPWYLPDGEVGGLLMYTGDITDIKKQSLAKHRIEQILKSTNKVSRIGTWELDIETDKLTFSDMSREILKLPKDYQVYGNSSLHLYKDGVSKDKIINSIRKIKETGEPFDLELEVINMEGEDIWIRDIGQAEFIEGRCVRVYGIFQDITEIKQSESALTKQNQLLSFAEKISKMGHWQWELKTNIVTWSSNLYDIMGFNKNSFEVKPNTLFEITHPDDIDKVKSYMKKGLETKHFDGELVQRIISEDNSVKTIQVLAKIFTDSDGEIIEVVGTCQDITLQRIAEIKFRGLLESAPDAMIILNENKRIHLVNKQAEKMFGYSASELYDKKIEVLIPDRIIDNFIVYSDDYFENPRFIKTGERRELIGINKDGEEFTVQISLSPLETEEGILVSAAIRDITAQKEAEQKIIHVNDNLKLLAQELTSKNIQLADFAQITSHNLRAPVSNLSSLVDLYAISDDNSDKEEVFEKFKKVVNHLTFTLNTLLEALKVKEGKVKVSYVYFDKTFEKTKEVLAGQIIESKAEITSDFTSINKTLHNKVYFESIFLNLIENAIKYRSKSRVLKLHLHTELIDGNIVLKVKDNGLGINLDRHRNKIFGLNKVFHRHPNAKGVGLYMTKLHVESMGGKISVKSVVGEGSTFIVKFSNTAKKSHI